VGYVDKNLLDGEVVTFRTRLHWRLFVPSVLGTVFVMLPIAIALVAYHFAAWAALPLALGAIMVLSAYLRRQGSEFAVTNKRVMIKLGVLSTLSLELLLSKVEGIAVNQDMFGKMFGYGDIIVTGSGGTKEAFSGIQRPLEFRRAIQAATDARENPPRG
jgi:uncharacterized membrane protein YdbT with pleckstrin-like domain